MLRYALITENKFLGFFQNGETYFTRTILKNALALVTLVTK